MRTLLFGGTVALTRVPLVAAPDVTIAAPPKNAAPGTSVAMGDGYSGGSAEGKARHWSTCEVEDMVNEQIARIGPPLM